MTINRQLSTIGSYPAAPRIPAASFRSQPAAFCGKTHRAVKDRQYNRIVQTFLGAIRDDIPCEPGMNGAILRAYPWWPNRFVHLEVTWERLENHQAWEFAYVGTGYSVHLDCRHRDIDLVFVLARGLESQLGTLKRRLSQDIYVPGRYRKSSNELFVVEDMSRIPEADDAPILVGCRLAQYASTLREPVKNLLAEAGYPRITESARREAA